MCAAVSASKKGVGRVRLARLGTLRDCRNIAEADQSVEELVAEGGPSRPQ